MAVRTILVAASALVSLAAVAQDKTPDPWKCPWKEMKTHASTSVPADVLKAYIVGQTIHSKDVSNQVWASFQYNGDGTCVYPRFDPRSAPSATVTDRACRYTIADGGLLCAVFDDDGSKHCDKIVDTGRNYERVDPDKEYFTRGTFRRAQDFPRGDFGCGSSG